MKTTATTPKPMYVLVCNHGKKDAVMIGKIYYGASEPFRRKHELEEAYPEDKFDVMKRLPDGTMTAEF